jgi:uncharacterized coiled-coil protein SlyX
MATVQEISIDRLVSVIAAQSQSIDRLAGMVGALAESVALLLGEEAGTPVAADEQDGEPADDVERDWDGNPIL